MQLEMGSVRVVARGFARRRGKPQGLDNSPFGERCQAASDRRGRVGSPKRIAGIVVTGQGIERPSEAVATDLTFKKAPESRKRQGHQKELGL
jgi:hypothetical protein